MRCPECKKRNSADAEYCRFCRAELSEEAKKSSARMKKGVALACCGAALIAAVLCLIFRSDLRLAAASYEIRSDRFARAAAILENDSTVEGAALGEYVALREDINEKYPSLLESFDAGIAAKWRDTAAALSVSPAITDSRISAELHTLSLKLTYLCSADENYGRIRADVLDLMDVFLQYNRLHLNDGSGNVSFIPSEEYARLDAWQAQFELLMKYAATLPDYENVYLLSYMLREARGELEDLREDVDSVLVSGYSVDDTVRYSGNSRNSFPVIKNQSGVSLTLSVKAVYEEYMRDGIRKHLVSSQLAPYYISE